MRTRIALISILAVVPALAATQEPARVGVGVVEKKLTLSQAIEAALKNNLELEIERTSVATAEQGLKAAQGAFDGIFRWQPLVERRNTPTSSILFGAQGKLSENFHNQNFSFLQKLPSHGSSLQAEFLNGRQTTNNPFVGLNPTLTTQFLVSFQQPLLRNRQIDRDRAELRIRSKQIEISRSDLELKVIDIVTRTELAYWDLVAARQDVKVKADGVEWAQEQLARNTRMIESGTLAPVELSAAEAELERRRDTYYASIGVWTEAENALKTLVAPHRDDGLWSDGIVPTDERALDPPPSDDLRQAVAVAVRQRPELQGVELRRQSNSVEKALAEDQIKPQVNLVANYTNSGLAGTQAPSDNNPFSQSNAATAQRLNELSARAGLAPLSPPTFGSAPPGLLGGYGSALSNLFGGNYQSFQVGLAMDWNTRNRAAQALLSQTVIAGRRLELEKTRVEQAVAAQVRNAVQAIQTARQRILAADASARAAKEKLESETRLFQAGESTNFFVLTRQNEYTDSLRRSLVARLDWNRAVARLQQALGGTLTVHRLRLDN